MKETIYEGRTQSEKIELLRANCNHSELQQVKIFFSEDDLNEMKSRLSEHCITKSGYEDELKDIGKEFMLTYNIHGELINSRKLRPQERQVKIFNMNNKTA